MSNSRRVAAASVLSFLAACTPDSGSAVTVYRNVSELTLNPSMTIQLDVPDDVLLSERGPAAAAPTSLTLGPWSHSSDSRWCIELGPDAVATANGKVLPVVSLGVARESFCQVAQWDIPDDRSWPTDSLSIVITDSSGTVHADFVNIQATRSFTVVSPTTGSAHVGDTVTLQLVPAADTWDFVFPAVSFDNGEPWSPNEDGGVPDRPSTVADAGTANLVDFTNGRATYQINANAIGHTEIHLDEAGNVGTSRCDVAYCEWAFITRTSDIPLTVLP